MAVPSDLRAKGMQRSSKALTLVVLLAAVALHSCAPVLGFLGVAPVSSGLRSVLPTRARLLARAPEADGEDGAAATKKKQKTKKNPAAARERLLKVLDEKKLATGDVTYSVYEQLDDVDSTPTFMNTSRYIGKVSFLDSNGRSKYFIGIPTVDLDAAKEWAAKAALDNPRLTDKMETKSEPKKATEKAVHEPKQAPEKKVGAAAALKQQWIEATQTLVAAMPDVKAEDLEVGQVVKGILRQSKDTGQVVSLGKELSGILLWIEAAEDGKRKESFRAGVEQEFRVLAKTTALGDGLAVLLTVRSGDLTRPPSMVEEILFASPRKSFSKKQDLSEFAGISPETWLEATVVNTAVQRSGLPPRVIVTLTAPGGSKKVIQAIFEKALPGPVSFGSKLKVRVVGVNLAKSRLGLTMLEKTPEETKA